jgi:hypothetical protein
MPKKSDTPTPAVSVNGRKFKQVADGDMTIGPETWRRLADAGEMITREEFIEELKQQGVSLTKSNLVRWQQLGILDKPIRIWHRGATRALYHRADLTMALRARALLDIGYRRDQISQMRGSLFLEPGIDWLATVLQDAPPTLIEPLTQIAETYQSLPGGKKLSGARISLYDDEGNEQLSIPVNFGDD